MYTHAALLRAPHTAHCALRCALHTIVTTPRSCFVLDFSDQKGKNASISDVYELCRIIVQCPWMYKLSAAPQFVGPL